MLYTEFNVGEKEYKLRLNARNVVALERKLGKNPISIFGGIENNELPKLEEVIPILHLSLQQFQNGISEDDTYTIFDNYVDHGGDLVSLIPVILELYRSSGIIPKEKEKTGEDGKN